MGVAEFVEIKMKISSRSFADSKNKPHVACGAYEIMVATLYWCSFVVWLHQPYNSALSSARCIYLLIFKKICNQISLCSRLDRYSSHQNQGVWKCWFFIHKQPYSVWKWKTSLEKVAGIQGIVSACNKKASSTTDFYFFCLLLETALLCHVYRVELFL